MAAQVQDDTNVFMSWILNSKDLEFYKKIRFWTSQNDNGKENPDVLWGWKRDLVINGKKYPESRTVYFSADFLIDPKKEALSIQRAFLYLNTRAKQEEIHHLKNILGKSRKIGGYDLMVHLKKEKKHPGFARLIFGLGTPIDYDVKTIRRLNKRKPRLKIDPPKLISESKDYNISKYAPFALCLGSGLSSESGLPLLGAIHKIFEVDDLKSKEFIFGAKDKLPGKIVKNLELEFKNFCWFNVDALEAKPSDSHEIIKKLWEKGLVKQIFTDNLDHVLKKVDVQYTQTRLSIFPDRFKAKFDPGVKSLLIIGIAVDRREVIKQARRKGLKIIAINPVMDVAPNSRNIDYLYKGDIFFKGKAGEVLPKIYEFLS
ncbi:MAG: hypothetical protein Q7K55_00550 [Candidatus Levybacteria bacterium]|nr:hypothetical protein [Candidatus Levybacteria bacterium]